MCCLSFLARSQFCLCFSKVLSWHIKWNWLEIHKCLLKKSKYNIKVQLCTTLLWDCSRMFMLNVKNSNLFVKACPAESAFLFAVANFRAHRGTHQNTGAATGRVTRGMTRQRTHNRLDNSPNCPYNFSDPAFCLGTLLLRENQQHEK